LARCDHPRWRSIDTNWGADDFLEGVAAQFRDKQGRLYGIPWIADIFMSGTTHNEVVQKLGGMPDTLDGLEAMLKKAGKMPDMAGFIAENHYGWTFISFLMSYGGMVFRNPPDDLMPVLDAPEAIAAADYYGGLLRTYGPDGVLSYVYDQVVQMLKQGKALYSTNNQMFLVQMAGKDSKVAETCGFSMFPAGPKGRYPQVATHGWGIPAGSKQKDAAWEFIKWAMSKDMTQRMFKEKSYSSVARRSVIEGPDFKKALTLNGFDVGKMYVDTIDLAGKGYMKYRTVPVYPQVDREIDAAIQAIVSQQKSAKEAMQTAQANAIEQMKRSGVKL
jgi:multiple sugar transport system substrate-binding protein